MFPLEKSGWLQSFLLTYLLITCFPRQVTQCVSLKTYISRNQISSVWEKKIQKHITNNHVEHDLSEKEFRKFLKYHTQSGKIHKNILRNNLELPQKILCIVLSVKYELSNGHTVSSHAAGGNFHTDNRPMPNLINNFSLSSVTSSN